MKTLYLDVCTLCRPFDDQQQLRIRLETDAVFLILRYLERGLYRAAVSPVLLKEVAAIKATEERLEIEELLRRFGTTSPDCDLVKARTRAEALCVVGFGVADAAHVAFAEQTADFFITCDDRLLKRCRKSDLNVLACSPVEFVSQEELE